MSGRSLVACVLCATAAPALARSAQTGELSWTGYAGGASGLVHRGISLNDETLVPHIDLALEHISGFYVHGWLTRVDLPQPDYYPDTGGETLWQTLLDVGYNLRLTPAWTVTLAHSWYRYSDGARQHNPDYREWLVSIDYNSLLMVDYARTERLWGLDEQQDAFSLTVNWPFTGELIGAATLGWVMQDGLYDDHYRYLTLNVGYLFLEDWSVQVQFHDSAGVGDVYQDDGARRKWVVQVSWHW